ncbi:hypothetical protein WME75_17430 [Sorangium sp. So ce1014]|uniref:hypothetical protein n=1 Tax=Sorangium sp. So ce1014 TaxID=3133326 RepID=UPI003F63BCAF
MQKMLLPSFVLVAVTLSASAMAANIQRFDVKIDTGYDDISDANELRCDDPFFKDDDAGEYLGYPIEFCASACRVKFKGDVRESANFYLLQKLTSGNYDCKKIDEKPTFVANDRNKKSKLLFKNKVRTVKVFAGGSDFEGNLYGACSFKDLDYIDYSCWFEAKENDREEDEEDEEDEEGEHADSDGTVTEG